MTSGMVGEDIALQPDGKIIAVGHPRFRSGTSGFVVHRYNANGTLDASFGAGGVVITPIGGSGQTASQYRRTAKLSLPD